VAITGSESEIGKQLGRLADAGVTEPWPIIFPADDNPDDNRRATRELLTALAAAS
jgi:hypothetical protein